jgi:hypothetical protein
LQNGEYEIHHVPPLPEKSEHTPRERNPKGDAEKQSDHHYQEEGYQYRFAPLYVQSPEDERTEEQTGDLKAENWKEYREEDDRSDEGGDIAQSRTLKWRCRPPGSGEEPLHEFDYPSDDQKGSHHHREELWPGKALPSLDEIREITREKKRHASKSDQQDRKRDRAGSG